MEAIEEVVTHFDYLAARWQDEGEYEEFEEYVAAMVLFLKARKMRLVRMSHTPFELVFVFNKIQHKLTLGEDRIELRVRTLLH